MSWTAEPIDVVGDNKQEVLKTLKYMTEDIKRPVLKESELERKLNNTSKNYNHVFDSEGRALRAQTRRERME